MNKPISILDKEYLQWVKELCKRYRQSQIKAAVKVNTEMLKFYWSLGRDIVALKAEARWGSKFFVNLSRDLKELNPKATCFSPTNLLYMKNFFRLYQDYSEITPQVGEQFEKDIFSLPWGHHKLLIDKFLTVPQKALFSCWIQNMPLFKVGSFFMYYSCILCRYKGCLSRGCVISL